MGVHVMKRLLGVLLAAVMLLFPYVAYAEYETQARQASPIHPTLVHEGEFAIPLVEALEMGVVESEEEAVHRLIDADIEPTNGWIADYPMTPQIVGELATAIAAAAESNKMEMSREAALEAFNILVLEFGLSIPGDLGPEYADGSPVIDSPKCEYEAIKHYYDEYGPPVLTYCRPPYRYDSMYRWVPYDSWWYGYRYPGYYFLHSFHYTIRIGHHRHRNQQGHQHRPHNNIHHHKTPVKSDHPRRISKGLEHGKGAINKGHVPATRKADRKNRIHRDFRPKNRHDRKLGTTYKNEARKNALIRHDPISPTVKKRGRASRDFSASNSHNRKLKTIQKREARRLQNRQNGALKKPSRTFKAERNINSARERTAYKKKHHQRRDLGRTRLGKSGQIISHKKGSASVQSFQKNKRGSFGKFSGENQHSRTDMKRSFHKKRGPSIKNGNVRRHAKSR